MQITPGERFKIRNQFAAQHYLSAGKLRQLETTMTNEELKTGNNEYQIPLGSGLRKVERNEGEKFDVAGVRFAWKVKGEDTGYAFSIYEQELEPGEGVPLHCHAYGEVFYALSGDIDFLCRLAENPDAEVLLLEAGGMTLGSKLDWGFVAERSTMPKILKYARRSPLKQNESH